MKNLKIKKKSTEVKKDVQPKTSQFPLRCIGVRFSDSLPEQFNSSCMVVDCGNYFLFAQWILEANKMLKLCFSVSHYFFVFVLLHCVIKIIIRIYTLRDLGDLSNLICSPSRTFQQYSPPIEWIMFELGVFPIFLENDLLKLGKILGLTFFKARKDFEGFKTGFLHLM